MNDPCLAPLTVLRYILSTCKFDCSNVFHVRQSGEKEKNNCWFVQVVSIQESTLRERGQFWLFASGIFNTNHRYSHQHDDDGDDDDDDADEDDFS